MADYGELLKGVLKAAGIEERGFTDAMGKRGVDAERVLGALAKIGGVKTPDEVAGNAGSILGLRALFLSEKENSGRAVRVLDNVANATSESAGSLSRVISGLIGGKAGVRAAKRYTGTGVVKALPILGRFGLGGVKIEQTEPGFMGIRWPSFSAKPSDELMEPGMKAAERLLKNLSSAKSSDHLAQLLGVSPESVEGLTKALHTISEQDGQNLGEFLTAVGKENPDIGEALASHFQKADAARSGAAQVANMATRAAEKVTFANKPAVNMGAAAVSVALAAWVMKSMNTRQQPTEEQAQNGMQPPPSRWKQAAKFLSVSALLGVSAVATFRGATMPNAQGMSWVERMAGLGGAARSGPAR